MQDSKFISILKQLSTRERSRFREYVHSPFFNKHEASQQLCDYILEYAPDFEDEQLEKERAFQSLFPKEKYEDQRIYTLLSYLLQLLNGFLAQLNFEQSSSEQKYRSLQELRRLGEEKQWKAVKKQWEKIQNKSKIQDEAQYLNRHYYYQELDTHFIRQGGRSEDPNLQLKSNYLDLFYLSSKLKTACDMQNRNRVVKANYQSWELDSILKLIHQDWDYFQQYPPIKVYATILSMLQTQADEDYYTVKALLPQYLEHFKGEDLKLQYDYLINHIIQKLNTGSPEWYREFLELHQFLLDEEILLVDGYLPEWDYKNIVTVALRIDEFDWTKHFIYNYKKQVKESVRENVFNYNLASYYFASRQYKEALQLLMQIEFSDSVYQLGAKIIQLKSYFALEEWEAALSHIAAFRKVVERDKSLSDYRQQANLQMLKLAKKLVRLSQDWDYLSANKREKRLVVIQKGLDADQPIANRDWIVNQFGNLVMAETSFDD
jgi:hypothetical protein